MSGLVYYVMDTETTGLTKNWHEIFQISIIRCEDRHQYSKYIKVEHPERASDKALEVTGKTMADLRVGANKNLVVDQINSWLTGDEKTPAERCMVGHNIAFDRRFCFALWDSVGKKFPAHNWLDTENIAKNWANKFGIEKPKRLSLQAALKLTNINSIGTAHNAISDARNTYLIWKCGVDEEIDNLLNIKRELHGSEEESDE